MKRAVIFGGTGQMGSYLYEYLLAKKYEVTIFGSSVCDFSNEPSRLRKDLKDALPKYVPDEIYNFAAAMHAEESWKNPSIYMQVNALAVQVLLDVIYEECPRAKFFNAGSADMFDKNLIRQDEEAPRRPNSPHALSKLVAYELVKMYRDVKGLFACTGIFFNAESPRRNKSFFAQKVASEVVRLKRELEQKGTFEPIYLGSLSASRDWGWAPEYVAVAWKMLQIEFPVDLVIGTGEIHTCVEFVYEALRVAGLPDVDSKFDEYVRYDQRRSICSSVMWANISKTTHVLGWSPKYRFNDVVRMLVEAEVKCGESIAVG